MDISYNGYLGTVGAQSPASTLWTMLREKVNKLLVKSSSAVEVYKNSFSLTKTKASNKAKVSAETYYLRCFQEMYAKATHYTNPTLAAYYVAKCYQYAMLCVAKSKGYSEFNEKTYLPFMAIKMYKDVVPLEMRKLNKLGCWCAGLTAGVKESTIKYELKKLKEFAEVAGILED